MPCSKCGQKSESSLAAEREREARAIERKKQAEASKAQFQQRRQELIAQVKRDRESRGR